MQDSRAVYFLLTISCLAGCAPPAGVQDRLQLEGVGNFRDVGGYRTADGRIVRRGVLYRSGELSRTTASDREKLLALGIRKEIDLRTEPERAKWPSRWGTPAPKVLIPFQVPVAVPVVPSPAGGPPLSVMSPQVTAPQANSIMVEFMTRTITMRAGEMGTVMRELARGDLPALIHCSGGKDRTGVTVAVLMTLLGVAREDVYQDYLRSNEHVALWYEQKKAKTQASGLETFELFKVRSGVDSAWLDAAFQSVEKQHESFDGFVRDRLKLTTQDIEQLQARFLQQ